MRKRANSRANATLKVEKVYLQGQCMQLSTAAENDILLHPTSGMDSTGSLFWRGGNLYRGIRPVKAELYRHLFQRGIIDELVGKRLLIDSWPVDWTTSDFPLILQHREVSVVSYPSEWCASQLTAAALHILDLELELRRHGLTLGDVNPWNVLFENTHPYYVDFCSITTLSSPNDWLAREQFEHFFWNPLLLFKRDAPRVARRLLFDQATGVSSAELGSAFHIELAMGDSFLSMGIKRFAKAITPTWARGTAQTLAKSLVNKVYGNDKMVSSLTTLRTNISGLLKMPSVDKPRIRYYDENYPEFSPSPRWTKKHCAIEEILRTTKPQSVLDVGSNRGWYAELASRSGARVIAADNDESCINALYWHVKHANLPILPIVMDIRFPEPAQGPAYRMLPAATDRFRSEMVFALGIVHHLVFTYCMTFDQIVNALEMFCSRWLVIEFVGVEDAAVWHERWGPSDFPWYNLDNFVKCLKKHFEVRREYPSDLGGEPSKRGGLPKMDREILLCARK